MVAIDALPPMHEDPFDRVLVVQALVEGITLLTTDTVVAAYPAPVRAVWKIGFQITIAQLQSPTGGLWQVQDNP
jgi:hypothetical protein